MKYLFKTLLAGSVFVFVIVLSFALTQEVFAQGASNLPDNKCKDGITLKWYDLSGSLATSPVVGGKYKARVDFSQDPDCGGKITTDVAIFKDGIIFRGCNDLAVSVTDPAVLCEFSANGAGVYTAGVSYKDRNGTLVEQIVRGSSFIISGGVTPTPLGGPTVAPTVDAGGGGAVGTITNPISYGSLGALVVGLIKFLMTMLGALAVLFIIIGAVRMVASAGNETAVKAGKSTVTWAVIGLAVALLAFSFISLLQSVLGRN